MAVKLLVVRLRRLVLPWCLVLLLGKQLLLVQLLLLLLLLQAAVCRHRLLVRLLLGLKKTPPMDGGEQDTGRHPRTRTNCRQCRAWVSWLASAGKAPLSARAGRA